MENLLNEENLENIRDLIESKLEDIPGELILLGGAGTLLLSSYLTKKGNKQAAAFIGSLAVPILAIGLAKYKDLLKTEAENFKNSLPTES